MGYKLEVTDEAMDMLAEKGYDPAYGARPLRRVIQKYLEDSIAEEILKSEIQEGDSLIVVLNPEDKKEIKITVQHNPAPPEKVEESENEE
jgi:ATP-dependent Clp protease ATP-binding subunit ClpC